MKLTDLIARGEDQLVVKFQLQCVQLVQFAAHLPPIELGGNNVTVAATTTSAGTGGATGWFSSIIHLVEIL